MEANLSNLVGRPSSILPLLTPSRCRGDVNVNLFCAAAAYGQGAYPAAGYGNGRDVKITTLSLYSVSFSCLNLTSFGMFLPGHAGVGEGVKSKSGWFHINQLVQ